MLQRLLNGKQIARLLSPAKVGERYAAAVFSLLVAGLFHWCLAQFGGTSRGVGAAAFVTYLISLLYSAWQGYGPGLLWVAIAATIVPFFVKPGFTLRQVDLYGFGALALLSVLISRLASSRRRAEQVLRLTNAELDQRVHRQTAELEKTNVDLRHRVAELEGLYAKAPVGLCYLDKDLRVVRLNDQFARIAGGVDGPVVGSAFQTAMKTDLAVQLEAVLLRVMATRQPISDFEITTGTAPDVAFWLVHCAPVDLQGGNPLGVQVILQDITEPKRAQVELSETNAALRRTNEALRQANDDLSQFAYISAHDLQEPIRTVVTLSQWLDVTYRDRLDDLARDQFRAIVQSGRRMSQLISDVLAYSQVAGDDRAAPQEADLQRAFDTAAHELQAAISISGARIEAAPLPVVPGNQRQYSQLFENLLSNAIKYARPGVQPEIRITAEPLDGQWLFSFADNGQGFAQEHAERVFGMFKRLHGRDVPGSGIGLAICRRVVERHGGRMWAEGNAGLGATFYFTLPAIADAELIAPMAKMSRAPRE
ncbi:MAG: PAS domain-containing protein [Bryobacterales bacterium]|nr:PAS domain-containing protein [Bryobacterales bacterium]